MARSDATMIDLKTPAPSFCLPNTHRGLSVEEVSLEHYQNAPLLVAFLCNHCPFVIHIQKAFVSFAREYMARGLKVAAICSNDAATYPADGPEQMAAEASRHDYPFPYLHDESQQVARDYQAVCTPDFFLYDQQHELYYRGRFDASTPGNNQPITGNDMIAAAELLLTEKPAPRDQHPSIGCSIKWK